MREHTRHDNGPWEVLFEDDGAWVVGKPDERETRGDYSLGYSEIHMARVYHLEANARLIAAAPEIYEALKFAKGCLQDAKLYGAATTLNAILARIEGEGE